MHRHRLRKFPSHSAPWPGPILSATQPRNPRAISLEASYILEAEDGTRVAVFNRGLRVASPEVTARMMKGEAVAPSEYYFRTSAEFEAPVGSRYEWMNKAVFIGVAERKHNAAVVHFYQVQ